MSVFRFKYHALHYGPQIIPAMQSVIPSLGELAKDAEGVRLRSNTVIHLVTSSAFALVTCSCLRAAVVSFASMEVPGVF